MTITVTSVANTQSFGAWLSTTNRLTEIISQNTVTVDTSTGGSISTGNGYVNGHFGANYLYVANGLSGGNVSSNGVLDIVSNVAFKYSTSNLVTLTANSTVSVLTIAVTNVNITANSISIIGNTTFANAVVFSNSVTWSSTTPPVFNSNVTVNTAITVGNTTVNAVINSTSLALSNSTVSYALFAPTAAQYSANDYYLNANGQWSQVTQVSAGGSNTFVQFNDSGIFGGGSGLTFNKLSNTLTVGITTINSTVVNATSYIIGTSLVANATGVYTTGVVNGATISVGSSIVANSSRLVIGTAVGLQANGEIGTANQALFSNGTSVYWANVVGGATLTANNTDTQTFYIPMSNATSGSWSNGVVSNTKLYFVPSTGTLNATIFNSLSDKSKKTNVVTIQDSLNTILEMRGVEFKWLDTGEPSSGVIAQELEVIAPHLVKTDISGTKSVHYDGIIPYLIQAIHELNEKIKRLENG
jgi:hypothetical protein